MNKKYILLLITLLAFLRSNAQQEHHYTQFMYNKLLLNPAYAGSRGIPMVSAIYRNQWVGFEGSPKSALASFNTPFLVDRVGIGVTISHRQIGLQRDLYTALAYSYNLLNKEQVSLRVGLQVSGRSLGMDFAKATPILDGDPSIADKKVKDLYFNVGGGIYGLVDNKYYFGIGVPGFYANRIGLENGSATLEAKEQPHFYAMTGGNFRMSEDISILPALLLKYTEHAPVDADINVNLDIKRKVTLGISCRTGGDRLAESVDFLAFFQVTPMIGIGGAYDFTLSEIKDYSNGTFEALLQIDLKQKKNNMSNPRFFF